MEHRSGFQLLLSFVLLCILCSQAAALPPLGTYSTMRLGNRLPFEGASESEHAQASLKPEADILQTTLPENDKFYFDVSRALDRNARHSDGLFTSMYSKYLRELAVRRYLDSLLGVGNSSPPVEQPPVKRHSDAVFTDNYSRFRKQMAVKKYLNSVLAGKRSQEELNPSNLRDETELLDPAFSENYDDVTVDELELLNHLPRNL
ncbi:VIP peptides [Elgaria multicarinata webbii]|uniref:VIP peptides n=1 Tax=Elgaria multicarinata webbii TaxID=159646 RepID=UPI002FCD6080